MKERFIENGIEYVRNGDYYIPNLTVPDDKVYNIGKYGRLHSIFIKENRPTIYSMKMLNGTWLAYLEEIDTTASNNIMYFFISIAPYAHGSAAFGGLMSDNINCSHKNHSPVDGFVRSLICRGESAPPDSTCNVR